MRKNYLVILVTMLVRRSPLGSPESGQQPVFEFLANLWPRKVPDPGSAASSPSHDL